MANRHDRVRSYYDNFSLIYDKEREVGYFGLINRLETEFAKRHARDKRVLEVGCGTGLILRKVAPIASRAVGLDLSPGMSKKARKKGLEVVEASATSIPFPDGSFDLVYSYKVLPHVPDVQKAILEMCRVVSKGGLLIMEFYNPWSVKFLVNFISRIFKRERVYVRYDSLSKIKSYLPARSTILEVRGFRVVTPCALVFRIPLLKELFTFLEMRLAETKFAFLGGYLAVAVRLEKK